MQAGKVMLEKYKATIHGNRIEWEDEAPESVKNNDSVGVYVTVIDEDITPAEPNGKKLAAILQKIADRGGISSIEDPVKWQRSIRKDQPLPGR